MTSREQLERQLANITSQLDRLDMFPAQDPYKDGQALRLKWISPTQGRTYTYVALRAGGKWYTTGREATFARSWTAFVDWLILGQVDRLELLVSKEKYDRKLLKARTASRRATTESGLALSRSVTVHTPDAAEVKDLFEDMVVLRDNATRHHLHGFDGDIPVPVIDRLLWYAKQAITHPDGGPAAVLFAAIERFENGMAATDARDRPTEYERP